jgi:protease-4
MSPPVRRTRREIIVDGITVALVAIGVLFVVGLIVGVVGRLGLPLEKHIGLVELSGVIRDPDQVNRQLRYFSTTDKVPAVILRIDSPGGSVGASQEINRQVHRLREDGVKVVASMGNVAASGGYYVAIAADTIVANPGTVTGSIGVIAEFTQADTLFQKVGLTFNVITTGKYKDTGSPFRPMRPDEVLQIRGVILDAFDQFVEAVSTARKIPREKLMPLAQGQVMTGRMARQNGLVDTLGSYDDAVRIARRMAGLGADAKVVRPPVVQRGIIERLMSGIAQVRDAPSVTVSYRMP